MLAKTGKMPDLRKRCNYEYAKVFRIDPTGAGYNPADFDAEKRRKEMLDYENGAKEELEPEILSCAGGYFNVGFPLISYGGYGYVNYVIAYALYPEVMERHFSLQADLYTLNNEAVAHVAERDARRRPERNKMDGRGAEVLP